MTIIIDSTAVVMDGRHRLGRPGLAHRPAGQHHASVQRARHRRDRGTRLTSEGLAVMFALLSLLAMGVSGWYVAPGATAVAQMLAK